ncbi:MAG: carotenoid biosynthesis protein [Candidatus Heimdallarchaeota archaeon]
MALVTRLFELIYIVFFIIIIIANYRRKYRRTVMELFSIVVFALILEYLSIKTYDAYQYSSDFVLQIGSQPDNVPIVIALAWAIIIGVSMKISDSTKIAVQARPFLDTLLALTIDLSMDVIAIRIEKGLWNWKIELSNTISFDSLLGVRYGNFIGWYFIVLIFSMMIRFGRDQFWLNDRTYGYYLSIIPFLAFIPFYISFESIQQGKRIFYYDSYFVIVTIFLILFAVFIVLRGYDNRIIPQDGKLFPIELIAYYSFHLFFLIALLNLDLYNTAPVIILPSIVAIFIHYITHTSLLENYKISQNITQEKYTMGK